MLCDRFADSTLAYQGFGHGLPSQAILQLYHFAVGNFSPDLTLILDLSIKQGLARAAARGGGGDRYERMDVAFHQRLRDGFLSIATLYPERCVVIEADAAAAAIAARILALVEQRLT